MAVICPRCENPVEQDFGVVTCTRCLAVLFVNMDGEVQITEDVASPEPMVNSMAEEPRSELASTEEEFSLPSEEVLVEEFPGQTFEAAAEVGAEPFLEPDPAPIANWEESEATGIFESSEQVLGAIAYSIKIENIDTKEIRHSLIQALDDSKFQWDPREILRSLKEGTIELKNLNPVKASIVVRRVRDLPVKISWKQDVYS